MLRLGLRMINGLSQAGAQRIVAVRESAAFDSVDDLARRAQLDKRDMKHLADAGALSSLAGHRRHARWQVAGVERMPPLLRAATIVDAAPQLAAPHEAEDIVADYRSVGLTLGRHPLALLRRKLSRLRMLSAEALRNVAHGRSARAAGIVTCRQRPDTASGVVFVTLEDETGYVNVVVWSGLVERQRQALLGARLLGVHGTLQREGEVVHLIARRLVDYSALLGSLAAPSRDFH